MHDICTTLAETRGHLNRIWGYPIIRLTCDFLLSHSKTISININIQLVSNASHYLRHQNTAAKVKHLSKKHKFLHTTLSQVQQNKSATIKVLILNHN